MVDVVTIDNAQTSHIIDVGIQGPAGPPANQLLGYTAGEALGGHRMVVLDADQHVVYADHNNMLHANSVLGMTTGASGSGNATQIQTRGDITEPSWNWIIGSPVFLGTDGTLTQSPPVTGFLVVVGFPLTATKLFIDIGEPTIL